MAGLNYSKTKLRLCGFEKCVEDDKDFILNTLNVGDHLYFRNQYENEEDSNTIVAMRQFYIVGYVPKESQNLLLKFLQEGDIADVVVSSKKLKGFSTVQLTLDVYYYDDNGDEDLPYYPLEGRQVSVFDVDKWNGVWDDKWANDVLANTDFLFYQYPELYKSRTAFEEFHTNDEFTFENLLKNYHAGLYKHRKDMDGFFQSKFNFKDEASKDIVRRRLDDYMEIMGYKFID